MIPPFFASSFRSLSAPSAEVVCICRCGHCKTLKPDWAKVSEELTPIFEEIEGDDEVIMAATDCTAGGSDICGKYSVNGYPTLMYFPDTNAEPVKYEEARTAKALKKWAIRKVSADCK